MWTQAEYQKQARWGNSRGPFSPMSKGNRGILIAVGIAIVGSLLIGLWTWPSSRTLKAYHYEDAHSGDYRPGGKACEPRNLAAIRNVGKAERERDACAEEAENHRLQTNGLVQQTRAADAAEAQAVVTNQSLWMVFFQTVGGFLTLVAAGAAAFYAADAARAAHASLDHAKEATRAELRPYLLLSKFTVVRNEAASPNKIYDVSFVIENFGSTPAVIVSAEAGHAYFDPEIGDPIETDVPWEQPHTGYVLGHGHTLALPTYVSARRVLREGEIDPDGKPVPLLAAVVSFRVVYRGLAGAQEDFTTQQAFRLAFQQAQPDQLPEYLGWVEILQLKKTT